MGNSAVLFCLLFVSAGRAEVTADQTATEKVRSLVSTALNQMIRDHRRLTNSNLSELRFMLPDGIHIHGYCSNIYDQSTRETLKFSTGDGHECTVSFTSLIYLSDSGRDQFGKVSHNLDMAVCKKDEAWFYMDHKGATRPAR